MKHKFVVLLIAVLFVTAVCGTAWFWATGKVSREKLPEFIKAYFDDASNVTTLVLQGNIEVREVRLGFEVSGRISSLLVDEGDTISPGQFLAKLEPDYFEDAVKQAEASLEARKAELLKLKNGSRPEEIEQARANTLAARVVFLNAQKNFLRANALVTSGAVSQEKFDNAQAARDRAEAQMKVTKATRKLVEIGPRDEDISRAKALVKQTQAQLDEVKRRLHDSKLFAPSGGIVQTRVREPGDYVNVGEPVYTITIKNPVWVRTYVNEMNLGRIRPGMKAVVRSDAGKSYKGQVGFISPVAEFTPKAVETRKIRTDLVYRIRVIVQDPKGQLRQGMPVTTTLILNSRGEE